jgi:uncharacterized alpha-E superfamily protein
LPEWKKNANNTVSSKKGASASSISDTITSRGWMELESTYLQMEEDMKWKVADKKVEDVLYSIAKSTNNEE